MEYYSVPWPTSGARRVHLAPGACTRAGSAPLFFFAACCVRPGGFLRVRLTVKVAILFIFLRMAKAAVHFPQRAGGKKQMLSSHGDVKHVKCDSKKKFGDKVVLELSDMTTN